MLRIFRSRVKLAWTLGLILIVVSVGIYVFHLRQSEELNIGSSEISAEEITKSEEANKAKGLPHTKEELLSPEGKKKVITYLKNTQKEYDEVSKQISEQIATLPK